MKKSNQNSPEKDTTFVVVSIGICVFIIGLWLLTYFLMIDLDPTERGTIGDMFGSINALFSGLALAGIILTIYLQRKELKFQGEELKETRKEFEIQNETLKIQRFENTFYNLITQHQQIVNAIDLTYYKKKEKDDSSLISRRSQESRADFPEELEVVNISGRDVFKYRFEALHKELKNHGIDSYSKIYLAHYNMAQTDFGHYFRNLYRIIKIIDETEFFYNASKMSDTEVFKVKYKYAAIIRAQISDYELLWLFYNCLSINGIQKFKPYVEKYSLFKNLPKELIPHKSHLSLYNDIAYAPLHAA